MPLDASKATNGNVTLRIDLLTGGYAALDNFRIAASDDPGDVGDPGDPVATPEPSTILGIGALGFGGFLKRKLSQKQNKR